MRMITNDDLANGNIPPCISLFRSIAVSTGFLSQFDGPEHGRIIQRHSFEQFRMGSPCTRGKIPLITPLHLKLLVT